MSDAGCSGACSTHAALAAECDLPELRVRGPELEDPRFHAQVDQLVIGVNRHYPELLSIEARLRVTVAPVLDALQAQLLAAPAWEEPSACLPADVGAARARVEAMLAALEALVTAARDTVGTATD